MLSYHAMQSKVKRLEDRMGVSRMQQEAALGRLLDDLLATVLKPKEAPDTAVINNANIGSKEDLPVAMALCKKYDIATGVVEALEGKK